MDKLTRQAHIMLNSSYSVSSHELVLVTEQGVNTARSTDKINM